MTEAEWLTVTDPQAMLAFIRSRASERKLRWYCVEAVRPFSDLFFHPTSRVALAVAEDVAEGRGGEQELVTARREAWAAFPFRGHTTTALQIDAARAAARTVEPATKQAAEWTTNEVVSAFADREEDPNTTEDEQHDARFRGKANGEAFLANLLRDWGSRSRSMFPGGGRGPTADHLWPQWLLAVGPPRPAAGSTATYSRAPTSAAAGWWTSCWENCELMHCGEIARGKLAVIRTKG